MKPPRFLQAAPPHPVLVFDGDCGFCRRWIRRWQQAVGDKLQYLPYQSASTQFSEIPLDAFSHAVQFIEADGRWSSGAEAVFRSLAYHPDYRWLRWAYDHFPGAGPFSETLYALVARHRPEASRLTKTLWGDSVDLPSYWLVRSLFLRGLAVVYLLAFGSLWQQIPGLIGQGGILPAQRLMEQAQTVLGHVWYRLPTLAWIRADDAFLQGLCGAGIVLAILAFVSVWPRLCFTLLWFFYLSLVSVGGDFLSFQWDALLLETGLLAILFAPAGILPRRQGQDPPSRLSLWLLRWLLFRLMFESGLAKWGSGDPTWRHFTALQVYYETQPLPNPVAWFMHQLPAWFHTASCAFVFVAEVFIPWLILTPRRLRRVAFSALIMLQLLILLSGNYAFFNLLTIVLCFTLLEDKDIPAWIHSFVLGAPWPAASAPRLTLDAAAKGPGFAWRWLRLLAGGALFVMSTLLLGRVVGIPLPVAAQGPLEAVEGFRSVNTYGLFAVMTTSRPEILVEGSRDGRAWQAYDFKYKPQALDRRPPVVAPYQPRLDWQMWFAAISPYQQNMWFLLFCQGLLQGSKPILALLRSNPFGDVPPIYIRATVYDYHFTSFEEHRRTGRWWRREEKGLYCPILSFQGRGAAAATRT
jgi:lipase maturation factor 1